MEFSGHAARGHWNFLRIFQYSGGLKGRPHAAQSNMTRYSIGRNPDNDIVIQDPSVSRRHAELEGVGNRRYRLADLDSSAGTFLFRDGAWQQKASWDDVALGDRVRFGDHETSVLNMLQPEHVTQARDRDGGNAETSFPGPPEKMGAPGQPPRQVTVRLILTIAAAIAVGLAVTWVFGRFF